MWLPGIEVTNYNYSDYYNQDLFSKSVIVLTLKNAFTPFNLLIYI